MCDIVVALADRVAAGVSGVAPATIYAKNSDRPPDEAQDLEWHPPRRDHRRTVASHVEIEPAGRPTHGVLGSRPRWMWGMEHGVNDAGVVAGNEAVWTTLDPRPFPDALTGMDLVRLALERASDAAEAVDVVTGAIERHGQGGRCHEGGRRYWSSFLLADRSGGYVVETSGRDIAVERVDGARALSNRLTIDGFAAAHALSSARIEARVGPRLAASRRLLTQPLTVASAKGHLRSHEGGADGWTLCMHADAEATTASIVVALPRDGDGRPVAHVAAGSPCRSIFVPVVVGAPLGRPPGWERFRATSAEQERLRVLEEELARDVEDDDEWNAEAWRRVSSVI